MIRVYTVCYSDQGLHFCHSDHSLHCLPLNKQFPDTSAGIKIDLFNVLNKYGMHLRCSIFGVNIPPSKHDVTLQRRFNDVVFLLGQQENNVETTSIQRWFNAVKQRRFNVDSTSICWIDVVPTLYARWNCSYLRRICDKSHCYFGAFLSIDAFHLKRDLL